MTHISQKEEFVKNNVLFNANELVEYLLSTSKIDGIYCIDYYETIDGLDDVDKDQILKYVHKHVELAVRDLDDIIYDFNELHLKEIIDDCNIEINDYAYKDPLEFYIVTDFMKEQLLKFNEPVIEIFNLNIWGRTTSGQYIHHDSIINYIMLNL